MGSSYVALDDVNPIYAKSAEGEGQQRSEFQRLYHATLCILALHNNYVII